MELVKGALVAGAGLSLAPLIAVRRELAAGDLAQLALADPSARLPEWEISLIRPKRREGATNAAADALAETLRRVLPGLTSAV